MDHGGRVVLLSLTKGVVFLLFCDAALILASDDQKKDESKDEENAETSPQKPAESEEVH